MANYLQVGDYKLNQIKEPLFSCSTNTTYIESSDSNEMSYCSAPFRYLTLAFKAGGLNSSTFSVYASTVGAGILSLPYAMNLSGLYQGIVILMMGMSLSLYTSYLLVLVAEKTKKLTYQSIGMELYGLKMQTFCEMIMIMTNYGTMTGCIVILKDIIPELLTLLEIESDLLQSSYLWGILITTLIIYPLSLMKNINSLRHTSVLSCLACTFLAISITYNFFSMRSGEIINRIKEAPTTELSPYNICTAAGIVIFSFSCQSNVVQIYRELNNRSTQKGFRFLFRALFIVFLFYIIIGIFGFLTFYREYYPITMFPVQILQANYLKEDILMIIVNII